MAEDFYDRLEKKIRRAEGELQPGEELAVWAAAPIGVVQVLKLGYWNPFMIRMEAIDADGIPCEILAHMSSVQLTLQKRKLEPKEKPRPFGFVADRDAPEESRTEAV